MSLPAILARERFAQALAGDVSDPLQLISLLPLFIDALTAGSGVPAERCLDDCVILAHGYAQLGIRVQARAVELVVTNATVGESVTHGTLEPWWDEGMIHGHVVLLLPELGCLVDPATQQFPDVAALAIGPVIAACPAPVGEDSDQVGEGPLRADVVVDDTTLSYTLAPAATTAVLLDHPRMREEDAGHRRRGMNVASATLSILAEILPPRDAARIPHGRAAALVAVIQGMRVHRTVTGDYRFRPATATGEDSPLSLDELLPPADVPRESKID